MELTQEYFDKALSDIKADIAVIKSDITGITTKMVTKDELKEQTKELKQYTNDAFAAQQVWMEEKFEELIVKYDVRDRVAKLEKEFKEFKLHKTAHS